MFKKIDKLFEKALFKRIELWFLLLILIIFWIVSILAFKSYENPNNKIFHFSKIFVNAPINFLNLVSTSLEQENAVATITTKKSLITNIKKSHLKESSLKVFNGEPTITGRDDIYDSEFRIPLQIDNYFFIINPNNNTFKKYKVPSIVKAYSEFDDTVIVAVNEGPEDSTSQLKKVDSNGMILWSIKINSHHSLHIDSNGYIYTATINNDYDGPPSKINMYDGKIYRDDGFAVISPDGKVLFEKSVSELMIDNKLGVYIYGVGAFERDPIHLNNVKPILKDTEVFKKGDLILSLRHQSMLIAYRPSTDKIVWYQVGPWMNQHDPDILEDGKISVFGNDVVSSYKNRTLEDAILINGQNEVYVFNPLNNSYVTPFSKKIKNTELNTITGGLHKIYQDGSIAIHFSNMGILAYFSSKDDIVNYYYIESSGGIDRKSNTATLLR